MTFTIRNVGTSALARRSVRRSPPSLRRKVGSASAWLRRKLREGGRGPLLKKCLTAFGAFFVVWLLYLWFTLPNIADPRSLIPAHSSVIVDRHGTELYRLFREEDRTFIDTRKIPKHMKDAIIAIEDERFYDRGCIDLQALARVVFRFGQAGGASTLTRQLARNALNLKKNSLINRKVKELILGCALEHRYGKDELLALYLNWIPFGPNAYGVELASQNYFGIGAADLSLAQAAVLAALPQRPSYFSPYGNHVRTAVSEKALQDIQAGKITKTSQLDDEDVAIGLLGTNVGSGAVSLYVGGRTDQVLRNMQDVGSITEGERLAALEELETMTFRSSRETIRAPHFVLWIKQQLEDMLEESAEEGLLSQGGLVIETTLDWDMQKAAEETIAAKHPDIARIYGAHNIALVAADSKTGEILSYVGNADYNDEEHAGKVDMARVPRQPGSSFKPIVYASAFEKGYAPATIVFDVPTKIGSDEPQNFDGTFWGITNIRRALGGSRNIPAIKAFFLAGGEKSVLDFAARIGAKSPLTELERRKEAGETLEYGWPLALGAGETPLLEMVQAYSTLANGGTLRPLVSIRRITRNGSLMPCPICRSSETSDDEEQVLDPRIAHQITSILSDVSARPGGYWQTVLTVPGTQAAAKTGTSNKCMERTPDGGCKVRKPSDLWTMGYTPAIVAGVWAGNADSSALADRAESLVIASPIWKEFLTKAGKLLTSPSTAFTPPSGIVQPQISLLSGEFPTECTPEDARRGDVFLQEKAPTQQDPACVRLAVDRVTGLLASPSCPEEAREERSFYTVYNPLAGKLPSGVQEDIEGWIKNQMDSWNATDTHTGSLLPLPLAPTEQCDISLTPGRLVKPEVTLLFPSNDSSVPYPSFRPRIDAQIGSALHEITFTLDGRTIFTGGSGSVLDPVLQAPRSVKEDGTHTLKVKIVDRYFNSATDEVTFRFDEDRSAPDVRFIRPTEDITITAGSTLDMKAQAEDDEGGIKYVQFFLSDQLLTTKPNDPYELVYNMNVAPGVYTLRAVATDYAGQIGEDSLTITVEP